MRVIGLEVSECWGADNLKVSPHATGLSGRWIAKGETKWSQSKDADIFEKGADDHIGLCLSSDLGSPNDEVRITIR